MFLALLQFLVVTCNRKVRSEKCLHQPTQLIELNNLTYNLGCRDEFWNFTPGFRHPNPDLKTPERTPKSCSTGSNIDRKHSNTPSKRIWSLRFDLFLEIVEYYYRDSVLSSLPKKLTKHSRALKMHLVMFKQSWINSAFLLQREPVFSLSPRKKNDRCRTFFDLLCK